MTRVARAFGQDWVRVYMQPFELTLYSYAALEDVERIDRLVAKGERIDLGYLMNAAFAGGKKGEPHPLSEANRRFISELRRPVGAGVSERSENVKRAEMELIRAIHEANAKRKVGDPVPAEVS